MPVIEGRENDHVKVWRPNGAKFAEAKSPQEFSTGTLPRTASVAALTGAYWEFEQEFGTPPVPQRTVIEIVLGHNQATATVYELPEESKTS
jgi:hypothetical protein